MNEQQDNASDHPEVQWALDLLKPDPNYEPGFLQKYGNEIVCMGVGAGLMCSRNWFGRRPYYAGIHGHIMAMAVGYVAAQVIRKIVDDFQAERDTRMRDYIIRHPDLFPEPSREKYSDVLLRWIPIR